MEWFIAVVVIATLGVAAMAAAGGMGEMSKEPVRDTYRQDLPVDRPLRAEDIQQLRFGITLRGYAMAQVDDLLDRLAAEISVRDDRIAELAATGDRASEVVDGERLESDPRPHESDPRFDESSSVEPSPVEPSPVESSPVESSPGDSTTDAAEPHRGSHPSEVR
jgi:DivIVA domain-containing protein